MSEETEVIEAEAREMGWKPEAEWKGDPPPRGFVGAEEFLATGKNKLPVVSAENKRLREEKGSLTERLEKLEADNTALKQGSQRFKKFADAAIDRERSEKEQVIGELHERRKKAIDDSDGEVAIETEKEIKVLEKELDALPEDSVDPEIDSWVAENPWYRDDPELNAIADGLSIALRREQPDLNGKSHLDELANRVRKAVPHKFKNPKRDDVDVVEAGHRRIPRDDASDHTFEALPSDAKHEYEEFKRLMPDFTKKEYAEQYDWSTE